MGGLAAKECSDFLILQTSLRGQTGLMPMSQRHHNALDQLLNISDVEYQVKETAMTVVTHKIAMVRWVDKENNARPWPGHCNSPKD